MNYKTLSIPAANHITVSDLYPKTNMSGEEIFAGFDGCNLYRSCLYFDIDEIPCDAVIYYAVLRIYVNRIDAADKKSCLYLLPLSSSFDEKTCFLKQPQHSDAVAALDFGRYYSGFADFNITQTCRDWISGNQQNYGIMLMSQENTRALFNIWTSLQCGDTLMPQLLIRYMLPSRPYPSIVKASAINVREQSWQFDFIGEEISPAVNVELINMATFFVSNKGTHPIKATIEVSADKKNWVAGAGIDIGSGATSALVAKDYGKFYRVKLDSGQRAQVGITFIGQFYNYSNSRND